jgi:hypothetical protein
MSRLSRFFTAALMLLVAGAAEAQQVHGIDIVEHGIYVADIERVEKLPNGMQHNIVKNLCHIGTTNRIATRLGNHFGLRYRVNGEPKGATVEIRRITVFPSEIKVTGIAKPLRQTEFRLNVAIGSVSYVGYGFDHDWELKTGPWKMQLWHGDRMLAEQVFDAVDPKGEPDPPPSGSMSGANANCFPVS